MAFLKKQVAKCGEVNFFMYWQSVVFLITNCQSSLVKKVEHSVYQFVRGENIDLRSSFVC